MSVQALPRSIGDTSGATAVEFALVGPLFIFLLIGIVVYGGWFWMAQGVQHLSAEGARAAIAGLDAGERNTLARAAITQGAAGTAALDPTDLSVDVASDARSIRVTVSYNAEGHPLMALSRLVPSPPRTITRVSIIQLGGY
jgi:Flp pilus assembly protein TadG